MMVQGCGDPFAQAPSMVSVMAVVTVPLAGGVMDHMLMG